MNLKEQILDLSRQNNIGPLSKQMDGLLDKAIDTGYFSELHYIGRIREDIVQTLSRYASTQGRKAVVLGMSGGVDSALTAALFKEAGWRVIGVTMPINQNPEETDRGIEACNALDIEHRHIDLTELFNATVKTMEPLDMAVGEHTDDIKINIRRGNIRARLRMITLYNLASAEQGLVASTDNLSELQAGFWTLHGDVGDLSPIQSLTKSWEVPAVARMVGVPESTWRATPTDGLGISNGDEAQLGCSYLEWDLMAWAITNGIIDSAEWAIDEETKKLHQNVLNRIKLTWFKRLNPIQLENPIDYTRLSDLKKLDDKFIPGFLK